jgi:hypothetical protein
VRLPQALAFANLLPLQVGTLFLQRCAAAGLSLASMGHLMSRPLDALDGDDSNPSELERACVMARQAVETAVLLGAASASLDSSMAGLALPEGDEEEELSEEERCGAGGKEGGPSGVRAPSAAGSGCGGLQPHQQQDGDYQQSAAPRREEALGLFMFDLEPEGEGSVAGSDPPRSDAAAPQSPYSQVSIDSVGSGATGSAAISISGMADRRRDVGESSMAVARSVYAGNGFMRRPPPKAPMRAQSPRRALGARVTYPPPVVAAPPRSTSEVLSGLSEEQWAGFLGHLGAIVEEHLCSGTWKQAGAPPAAVAMSCPRF